MRNSGHKYLITWQIDINRQCCGTKTGVPYGFTFTHNIGPVVMLTRQFVIIQDTIIQTITANLRNLPLFIISILRWLNLSSILQGFEDSETKNDTGNI